MKNDNVDTTCVDHCAVAWLVSTEHLHPDAIFSWIPKWP